MTRTILRERLPVRPGLGRHVNHDSQSRLFALPELAAELHDVRHPAHIGVLDQGQLGSCTGNAGVAAVYREPYVAGTLTAWYFPPTQGGAVDLYSAATAIDPFPGTWKPEDTGSDGLSVAKVLKSHGIISGYLWAFTVTSALDRLMSTPLMTGIPFLESMFDTDRAGHMVVRKDSGWAGGHELCVDEYRRAVGAVPAMVGGPNSWGTSWGDGGRWLLTVDEWAWLLSQQGDVTALIPAVQPAPVPDEEPTADPADEALWAVVGGWALRDGICARPKRRALVKWADAKGLD